MRALLVMLIVLAVPATAAAQTARRIVAVAPLTALGAEDTSASAKKVQADLEAAVAAIENTQVIGAKAALAAVKKAKRPELRVCEGDLVCLAELGKLLGADLVVAGEAGGLGDVKVVYLQLVAVETGKPVRSTTLEVGDGSSGGSEGAAYRLLAVLQERVEVVHQRLDLARVGPLHRAAAACVHVAEANPQAVDGRQPSADRHDAGNHADERDHEDDRMREIDVDEIGRAAHVDDHRGEHESQHREDANTPEHRPGHEAGSQRAGAPHAGAPSR